ncbi:anaerobic ribonucleoside-triphosphate reductase [Niallia alba]|uniref:anaerobic ribonucleoside-triphosphate reductase n=1 Tax=Niallia alba TaxID=2729105 RepID=UPI00399FF83D
MEQLYEKIEELINEDKSVTNENGNKDSKVFNTKRDLLAGIVAKNYALENILPKHIAESHIKGEIHFHDLDYSPFFSEFNCMLIDYEGMLKNGFTIGNADVERPKSIATATALMAQIVANVSSNIYGGTTFSRVDEVLEPYAKISYLKHLKEAEKWIEDREKQEEYAKHMTSVEIHDSMQSLEYEINTLFNSNGQTPFLSINFGLGTSWLSREIQKAILEIRIEGLGKEHKTAVFPKLIFTIKKGINFHKDDPNYDIKQLALECATKRMYPDILNYDKIVEITGDFKPSMGCRSFLSSYKNVNGDYITHGRMNMGVTTLNLPRVAIESQGNEAVFWDILEERLSLIYEALMFRINSVNKANSNNAPILYQYGATGHRLNPNQSVSDIFKNNYATVSLGYIGLHEVATVFYGNDWQDNTEAKEFTLEIMKLLKSKVTEWKEETGYGFSVYGTPSESLTDRFCRLDKQQFGEIKDITDKGYYTNSFHYDVRKKINPYEKIDFEMDYPQYSNGGFIHYCEFPSLIDNPKALESVWDYTYDKVGYFGTNVPIDECYECGYKGEFESTTEGFKCSNCSNNNPKTSSVTRRLCGYLGSVIQRPVIEGRRKEIQSRVKHT